MSVIEAKRTLAQHGKQGNWRFKMLLEAAMPSSNLKPEDVARAWPKAGQPSDYRFLANHASRDPETEMDRRVIGVEGTETHRILRDHKSIDNAPKYLSNTEPEELDGRTLGAHKDDLIKRTLFAGSSREEVNTLFRNELSEVVIEGARTRQIARDAANVMNVSTPRGDLPVSSDDTFAPEVAQGGEIRDDGENYTTVPYNTTKYGQGARVTDEMIDTANIDAIENEIARAGRAVENAINRDWLNTLVDDAGNDVTFDDTVDDPGYDALNRAYGEVDGEDFRPDMFVTHPNFRTELYSDNALRFANRAGSDETVRDRVFDPLLDMEHVAASGRTYDGDGEWAFDATDDTGAVAFDSEHINLVLYAANGQDIEIKDYEDPIRDLQGVNARVHCDTVYSQGRSACAIDQA